MEYAPIVVFAFNRLDVLKACIDSLLSNSEVSESDLIVYVDGPREGRGGTDTWQQHASSPSHITAN